jgi:hypothetical protein
MSGLSTTFVVDLRAASTLFGGDARPVRVITIRVHISRTLFVGATDVLAVYEGGSSLTGTRVAILYGTDALPAGNASAFTSSAAYRALYGARLSAGDLASSALWEVQVLTPTATVSFSSRATSGQHFLATYSSSAACPVGYFHDASAARCRVNLVPYTSSPVVRAVVVALATLAILFIALNALVVVFFWEDIVIRAASRPFLVVLLMVLLLLPVGSLFFVLDVSAPTLGTAACALHAWLTIWPIVGVLAVIIAKTNRVERIFTSSNLEPRVVSDGELARTVAALLGVASALLAAHTAVSSFALVEGSGPTAGMLVGTCASSTNIVYLLALCLVGALMAYAALLAYRTRDLPSNFNESAHILNALVVLILFCCIILPLDYVLAGVPNALAITHGVGQSLLALLLTAIIFLPKAFLLYLEGVYQHMPVQARSGGFSVGEDALSVFSMEPRRRSDAAGYGPEEGARSEHLEGEPAVSPSELGAQRLLGRGVAPSGSVASPSVTGSAHISVGLVSSHFEPASGGLGARSFLSERTSSEGNSNETRTSPPRANALHERSAAPPPLRAIEGRAARSPQPARGGTESAVRAAARSPRAL